MERYPYRIRTRLRRALPAPLSALVAPGRNCGERRHEWHLVEKGLWGCYHCRVETIASPFSPEQTARLRLAALGQLLATEASSNKPSREVVAITGRYVDEAFQLLGRLRQIETGRDHPHELEREIIVEPIDDPARREQLA